MTDVRSKPCLACPYRTDVPSGVWSYHEYEKLRPYDEETMSQPFAPFMCHATPEAFCNGWAVVHSSRGNEFDLIALRIGRVVPPEPSNISLFSSGNEAADHGQADLEDPSDESKMVAQRLMSKYERLRDREEDDD